MIALLEGEIILTRPGYLILKAGPIGYKIFTTPELLAAGTGDSLSLYIYHKSNEEGQSLYGLPTMEALEFFELLLSVSGVGPKTALGIVGAGPMSSQTEAIVSQNAAFFSQVAGIGKRTAERIVLELKDKVNTLTLASSNTSHVLEALQSLGYNPTAIRQVLGKLSPTDTPETQLKAALRLLSS